MEAVPVDHQINVNALPRRVNVDFRGRRTVGRSARLDGGHRSPHPRGARTWRVTLASHEPSRARTLVAARCVGHVFDAEVVAGPSRCRDGRRGPCDVNARSQCVEAAAAAVAPRTTSESAGCHTVPECRRGRRITYGARAWTPEPHEVQCCARSCPWEHPRVGPAFEKGDRRGELSSMAWPSGVKFRMSGSRRVEGVVSTISRVMIQQFLLSRLDADPGESCSIAVAPAATGAGQQNNGAPVQGVSSARVRLRCV